jgi:hypothetical protein
MSTRAFPAGVILALISFALADSSALAATSGQNGTHDPSRMIESEGKFYFFSTGGSGKSSPDGLVWSNGSALFPTGFPSWVGESLPDTQGLWAPDVIYLNGEYYLYYSVAARSTKACVIGLVTSPTLNPRSPNYKWTDRGLVVSSAADATHSTIDPAPILDNDHQLWLVWGGGYPFPTTAQSIWLTRLDNTTGLASASDPAKPGHAIELGHKEGPYIHSHGGNYYLFWQTGSCCSGASSTYTINVARSQSITGPYSGDRVFYKSHDSVHGPGHIGIYAACGVERFTYHYYPDSGFSVLGENELTWGADGWPIAGAESTAPIKPCGDLGSGGDSSGGGGSGGAGGSPNQDGGAGTAGLPDGSGAGGEPIATGGGGTAAGSDPVGGGGASAGAGPLLGGNAPSLMHGSNEGDAGCACSVAGYKERGDVAPLWMVASGWLISGLRRRKRDPHARPSVTTL